MDIRDRILVVFLALMVALTCLVAAAPRPAAAATTRPQLAANGCNSLLVKPDGSLWAWGYNNYGQLGLGDAGLRPIAFRVGTASDWATVACGDLHGLAVKSGGSLWSWGCNGNGQLGLGDTTARSAPVCVGSASDWALVSAGDSFSLALKSDGSLWAWGANAAGQLGLADTTDRLTPTRVGTASDWAEVVCGAQFALALRIDGSLWAWGANDRGQLGLGDTTTRLAPTRVGSASDWALASCSDQDVRALKTDGTLWSWGYNLHGQLGLGDTVTRSSPTQVGTGADWVTLACGDDHTVALKSDGSLWAWGANHYGDLGTGDTTEYWSPTRAGGDTDWRGLVCGDNFSLGLKSDGGLWSWGSNNVGQLSLTDFVDHIAPTYAFLVGDADAPVIATLASSTHPDATLWYANHDPGFSWNASDASGIGGYRYSLDQSAGGVPSVAYPSSSASAAYTSKADGLWYFHVRAVDRAGNWGPTSTRVVRIDATAPATTQTGADSAWQSGPVSVTFKASDALSGVASTESQIDGGAWTAGTTLTVTAAGTHTILYHSRDRAGNVEADESCEVKVDNTPPITTQTGSDDAWHRGPLTVTFHASDGQSGVATTEYSLDEGAWISGDDVTVSTDGVHSLGYRSRDNVGNTGTDATCEVKIDTTAPTTSDDAPAGWTNADVTVHLSATDAGSGMRGGNAKTEYSLDGGSTWITGSEVSFLADPTNHSTDGVHTVQYRSLDAAGTRETDRSFAVSLDTSKPRLLTLAASSVRRRHTAVLRYMVADRSDGSPTATVVIKVKTLRGKTVMTLPGGVVPLNEALTARFRCSLPRATYRFCVYATDAAGNVQTAVAKNTLKVR